jgi:hypothetical protein
VHGYMVIVRVAEPGLGILPSIELDRETTRDAFVTDPATETA